MAGHEHLGPWEPIELRSMAALLHGAPFRWWVSGGWALELHRDPNLTMPMRVHEDTDLGLLRQHVPALSTHLPSWELHIGADGILTRWAAGVPDVTRNQNNVWCRPGPQAAWAIDATLSDGDDTHWIFRRDHRLRRPWDEAVLVARSDSGQHLPYLAPEIQLLFKSKTIRSKDQVDAERIIPLLEPERAEWLASALPSHHAWQPLIV